MNSITLPELHYLIYVNDVNMHHVLLVSLISNYDLVISPTKYGYSKWNNCHGYHLATLVYI